MLELLSMKCALYIAGNLIVRLIRILLQDFKLRCPVFLMACDMGNTFIALLAL